MAFYVARQKRSEDEDLNSQFAVILGLASFFGLFTFGMAFTSIDLALQNLTQVESLGSRTVLHKLAILKPANIVRVKENPAAQFYYNEITYPLDAGVPPNPEYYRPTGIPRVKAYSHARPTVPLWGPLDPALGSQGMKQQLGSLRGGNNSVDGASAPQQNIEPVSTEHRSAPLEAQTRLMAETSICVQGSERPGELRSLAAAREISRATERLSDRDKQATRTFAILPMLDQGDNPWDLGSLLLNWETVMGNNVVDWFLPIRRSPCCSHEDADSQFRVGPWVDLLKSSVGFVVPRPEVPVLRRKRRRRRRRREHQENRTHGDSDEEPGESQNDAHPYLEHGSPETVPDGRGTPIPLQPLNGNTAAAQSVPESNIP